MKNLNVRAEVTVTKTITYNTKYVSLLTYMLNEEYNYIESIVDMSDEHENISRVNFNNDWFDTKGLDEDDIEHILNDLKNILDIDPYSCNTINKEFDFDDCGLELDEDEIIEEFFDEEEFCETSDMQTEYNDADSQYVDIYFHFTDKYWSADLEIKYLAD